MAYVKASHEALLGALDQLGLVNGTLFGGPAVKLLFPPAIRNDSSAWSAARTSYLAAAKAVVTAAGMDWQTWEATVVGYAEELRQGLKVGTGKGPSSVPGTTAHELALRDLLNRAREPHIDALKAIEPSIEKAVTAIEHELGRIAAGGDQATAFPDLLTAINGLSADVETPLKRRLRERLAASDVPHFDRHWADESAIAWLRYAERYELRASRNLIESMCADFQEEFNEAVSRCWPGGGATPPSGGLLPALWKCWVFGSSLRLRSLMSPQVGQLLGVASTWQLPNGAWPSEAKGDGEPCSQTTAMALACMVRHYDGYGSEERIRNSLGWVLSNPNEGGGWGNPVSAGGVDRLNLVATIAVLDAARLRGIPLEHPALADAEAALMRAQHPSGLWCDYKGRADEYLSPLVLGYFQRRMQRPEWMHEATKRGKGLLLRSLALGRSRDQSDLVLALAALYHGIEYVVYGFLGADDSVSIRDDRGNTIGLSDALTALERLAKDRQWISQAGRLPHRQQLAEIKARRDEVIHRFGTISQDDLDGFIEQALKFVDKFDKPALGFALLD